MRTLILLLVVAAACSRSETSDPAKQSPAPVTEEPVAEAPLDQPDQPPPASKDGQQAAEERAPVVDLDAPPTVELLDAGKPPRRALRTAFEAGAKQSLQVKSDWVLETAYGPMLKAKTAMPSLVYELEMEAKGASKESTRFEFRVTKATTTKSSKQLKPGQVEAFKKAGESLKGVSGSFLINARGMVEEFAIDTPPPETNTVSDMIDQIEQAVRLASLPLPEEPVGTGAKWTATQVITQRTARIQQTSTFELLGVKGERVRATSTYAAEAPKQNIKMPGAPNSAPFKLDKLESKGDGKGAWRLNQLGPSSATEHVITAFIMTAKAPKPETVIMAFDTTIEVKATK